MLSKDKMIITNGKIYMECTKCGKLIRTNKPILGSLHICNNDDTPEPSARKDK